MQQVSFKSYKTDLPIDKIDISKENVRKTQKLAGIEELKGSIERIGLVHPVIVMRKGDRYELIVGQRRFIAFKELGRTTIPALIIDDLDDVTLTVVSFGENIHRRNLPYADTIKVCNALFKEYEGSPTHKINQIAKDLGLSRRVVIKYLKYQLVPPKVREMVAEGKLSEDKAYRITAGFWPNESRILAIAQQIDRLTGAELDRALDIGSANPKESLEKIVEEAKKAPTVVQFTITMPVTMAKLLEERAKKRETNIHELILSSIERFLSEET